MNTLPDSTPPSPTITPARKSLRQRLSIVWLVPVAALLVSLWVVYTTYNDRGPLIEIAFENASGIAVDETELRYRDVAVGLVEEIRFSDGLNDVVAVVRLDKNIAPYVDADAQFWVVSPEVSAQGVSGLDTVLSGVYIQGVWNTTIDAPQSRFEGLKNAPLVQSGQEGIAITLRSSDVAGLSEGTPILYRGIDVGRIANLRLSPDGVSVLADAFVRAPEDRLITTATRFWDTSGFTFSFGAQGAQLDVSSLASLVAGGVAFDTIVSGGEPVQAGRTFQLFESEEAARNSVFTDGDQGPTLDLAAIFEGSVSGLTAGAAVDFQGINVGTVTAITGLVDEDRFGDRQVRLLATMSLNIDKMGLPGDATEEQALEFLDEAVARGLRAQLQNASILTGGLKVSLQVPDIFGPLLPEGIDRDGEPFPIIPTVPANVSDFSDTAEGVFDRINNLPIEELLGSAVNVLDSVNRLLNDEGTTATPAEVLALIGDVRALVGSDPVQQLPDQAGAVMASLQASVESLETLLRSVEEAGAVERLVAALDAAEEAAEAVTLAVADVDTLVADLSAVSRSADALLVNVNDLPLADLVDQATTILRSADSLLSDPATRALPAELRHTVAEARGIVTDLRASGVVDRVGATIASAQEAISRVTDALLPVIDTANASLDGVPALVGEIETVARDASALLSSINALPLSDVVTRVNGVVTSANALLNDPATRDLPGQVGAAVDAGRAVLAQLRDSGVIDTADATLVQASEAVTRITDALMPVLSSAQSAMVGLDAATDDLPRLTARAETIAAQIEALVASANEIPLDQLAARASALIDSANALLASPDTEALPGSLNDALAQIEGVLADMRAGGLIDNANATLAATEQAATAVADATGQLPALVERLNRLLAQGETVIGGYDASGPLGSDARAALRDIRDAANSVSSLARQIERSPNSLLFGR